MAAGCTVKYPMPCSLPFELLTAHEVRESDRLAEASGISVSQLMENAGRAVADSICKFWAPRKTLILCGPGNNGGDGKVCARILKERGWPVEAVEIANWYGVPAGTGLIVDALFGVGLSRAPEGNAAQAITEINAHKVPVIAVDVPSGVMADSGAVPGVAIRATRTVTFFRARPGLFLLPGKTHAGEVEVADIGIPAKSIAMIHPSHFLNMPALWRALLPAFSTESHKYTRGHTLVAGGPLASTGAAKLAATAALRAGAGLVSIACDRDSLPAYAASLTTIMTKLENFGTLVEDRRVTGLVIGPGNGVTDVTRARITLALNAKTPVVLDADALSVLGQNKQALAPLLHRACVLTPHEGEFMRIAEHSGDKLFRAKGAAHDLGCIIVLKGSDTVIAAPDGRAAINTNAPPFLATAGTGDVLAGLIGGLLAQGMDPFAAACAGVWMHGEAGQLAGRGLIAEDLPGLIPKVLGQL